MASGPRFREYDQLFKLVLIGDSGVGKSCLLLRFADDCFTESYITTIGVDFRFRSVAMDNNHIRLQIWDTAGQERFRTITSAYYRGADGILMVYDTADRESFDHIGEWLSEVNRYAHETAVKVLIGNKCDLPSTQRQVTKEEGQAKAAELGISFVETSAKESHNVEEAFVQIAKEILTQREKSAPAPKAANAVTVSHARPAEESGGLYQSCCSGSS